MIYLNRIKGILKKTNGFRKMAAYIYELRNKEKPFKVSRSKLSDYLTCLSVKDVFILMWLRD